MKPLLAHKYSPHRVTYPCYVQPKLNGVRALYQAGRFQSRDEQPFPVGLLDHLAQPLLSIFPPEVILDGELYVHGWSLQRILGAITPVRKEEREDTKLVEYHVFDVVDFNLPFGERFRQYCPSVNLIPPDAGPIKWVQWDMPDTASVANECYARFVSAGYEGMMYRLGDCPYTMPKQHWAQEGPFWKVPKPRSNFLSDKDNRTFHLLKRKDWQDHEFLIIGITEGEGRLAGTLGAVICETEDKRTFHVGSGFSDDERHRYFNSWPINRQAKVKYLCLSVDGIPLNPTILAIL